MRATITASDAIIAACVALRHELEREWSSRNIDPDDKVFTELRRKHIRTDIAALRWLRVANVRIARGEGVPS